MIAQITSILVPLFLIVAVGVFYGIRARPQMHITNQLVMDVFMPILIFYVMVQDSFDPRSYLSLVVAGVLLMLSCGILAYFLARGLRLNYRSFVPPAMFPNWANLGLPLYVLALGEAALGGGVVLVVVGNILCFTLGVYLYSHKLTGFGFLRTPIILAVIAGFLVKIFNLNLPSSVNAAANMMSQVAIPLMLFSLGVRLAGIGLREMKLGLLMAIFSPLVGIGLALLLIALIPLSPLQQNILILFGALPPAVINYMLAEQYRCDADQVASMVMVGNLAAFITLPLALTLVLSR